MNRKTMKALIGIEKIAQNYQKMALYLLDDANQDMELLCDATRLATENVKK